MNEISVHFVVSSGDLMLEKALGDSHDTYCRD